MKILSINNPHWLGQTVAVLKKGGLVIYPTETCYGIGVDSTNTDAVAKLLEYKLRPAWKAISIAVSDEIMASHYVDLNDTAIHLYRKFLPGPLTVISLSKSHTDSRLEAENKTLGIRIPDYKPVLELLKVFKKPITSTSANQAGKKTPYSYRDIINYSSKKALQLVDLYIDGGKLPYNPPSTVVDTTLHENRVIREGRLKFEKSCNTNLFITKDEVDTRNLAARLYREIRAQFPKKCLVFSLQGELGSGKTQFAKGIGHELKIKEEIISPTFTIIREYRRDNGMYFIHIDTWRLDFQEDITKLFLDYYFQLGNTIVIEWSEKITVYLQKLKENKKVQIIQVLLSYEGEQKRRITVIKDFGEV